MPTPHGRSLPLGSTFKIGHLWVVITRPAADGSVVMVNVTSWRQGCDETCIIAAGEHPFVHHQTVVAYAYIKEVSADRQREILANPTVCVPHAPVSPQLLERIRRGALASREVSGRVKAAIR